MKIVKRYLSVLLTATMTLTCFCTGSVYGEESEISAYNTETFIDIADIYNETRYLSNGYDLGGGVSIYIASTVADLALKAGWANTFTDGQAVTHRFVLTEGNSKILDLRPVGTTISVSNIDRAIKIDAPSAGKVTFYADVNERGYTSGKAYLVNSSGEIVSHIAITSFQSYIPQEVTIPEAGTYYYVVPNRICEMNIAAVRVSMEGSSGTELINGDVNLDNVVDDKDGAMVLKHIAGSSLITDEDGLKNADADGNGVINLNDVNWVLKNKTN